MNTHIILTSLVFFTLLAGCTAPVSEGETNPPITGVSGLVVQGATCQEDADCVYAINAYYAPKCVSANCPPAEEPQPEPFAEGYEWEDAYLSACLNAGALNNQNSEGENLLIDSRSTSCVCQPFQGTDSIVTSLDGVKLCQPASGNEN